MKFEIDFNYGSNNTLLEQLGAIREDFEEYYIYSIEIESFEDLDALLHIVDSLTGDIYSAVISFDNPTIYLDNKV